MIQLAIQLPRVHDVKGMAKRSSTVVINFYLFNFRVCIASRVMFESLAYYHLQT